MELGDVLRELKAHGLLERSTTIIAGDVRIEMLPALREEPGAEHRREVAAEQLHEETLFASS